MTGEAPPAMLLRLYFGIKGSDARRMNTHRKGHQNVFWNKGRKCKAHEYTPQGAEEWVEYKARRAKKPQHTGVCEDF